MDIFLTLETGVYLVKLEFTFATQLPLYYKHYFRDGTSETFCK